MVFSSYEFLFGFLPLTLAVIWLSARFLTRDAAIIVLIGASLAFYGFWDPRFLPLIVGSIAGNLLVASIMLRQRGGLRKALLIIGIAGNLSLLGYFKYANFFLENARAISGANFAIPEIILPIGISFFTFQQIAFLADLHTTNGPLYGWRRYTLFVIFFPQLIAGPIVHHKDIVPQFDDRRFLNFELDDLVRSILFFTIGLFKKLVIADSLALSVDPVFAAADAGQPINTLEAWGAAVCYSLQLYFDFSGYADMAVGLGYMFGVRLPFNFNAPYRATSIADFWRRWHMTLSSFLRNYLYIPLGGGRRGLSRQAASLIITMLLGGLWHGAGWGFVLWGILHGFYLVINHIWRFATGLAGSPKFGKGGAAAGWALTMLAVVTAWVPFRAETFGGAWRLWQGMFIDLSLPDSILLRLSVLQAIGVNSGPVSVNPLGDWFLAGWLCVAASIIVLILPTTQGYAERWREGLANHAWIARFEAGALASMFVTAFVFLNRETVFIYFQF